MIPVLVALGIGAAIALQATAVSSLTSTVHPLAISLALLASGILVASSWATARQAWPETLAVVGHWWWLPLGAVGWAIVAALGWTAGRLGVAVALALMVGSQLTVGLTIDVVRGTTAGGLRSVLGLAFVVVGTTLLSASPTGP